MTHGDSLARTVEATQRSLDERLGEVLAPHRDPHRPRDTFAATDAFLAATSRHLSAVEAVLVDQVRHTVPDADGLVHDYLLAARDLEHTMFLVKGRLYGEAHAIHLDWAQLWVRVQAQLADHNRLETRLVDELVRHGDPDLVDGLARRVFDAETHAPTRPHPMLPHLACSAGSAGGSGRWPTGSGTPPRAGDPGPGAPASAPARQPGGQYLVGDPRFDDHAHLLDHHHRHRQDRAPLGS